VLIAIVRFIDNSPTSVFFQR